MKYRVVQNKYIIILKINVAEENISQEFRMKDIEEIRNYFFEEINQNELVSKKQKKVCMNLNYI